MKITTTTKDCGTLIIYLNGRLDANTSPELQQDIKNIIESGETQLLINFQGIEYVSSAGLRVLITTIKLLKLKQGKLVLSNLSPAIFEVLKIAGFATIFTICETEQEALSKF